MAKELYKRVSPHLQRVLVDGGTTTSNMNDLLLLQRSNEQYKDYLKLSFCPELHGYKKDTRSNVDYITKGYSANSIQQELGPNLILNGTNLVDSNSDGIADDFINANSGPFLISTGNGFSGKYQQLSNNGVLYYQSSNIKIGSKYKVSFYYTSSGGCNLSTGANDIFLPVNTGQAKYYEIYLSNGNAQRLYIVSQTGSTLQIGNISLQEVLSNDLTQTSSANQPYLDKIAPAEKLSAKNPNGGGNYLTHPTISFGASDEWTVETTLNWSSGTGPNPNNWYCGRRSGINTLIGIESNNKFTFYNDLGIRAQSNVILNKIIGKATIITITGNGNNVLKVYLNGILIDTLTVNTSATLGAVIEAYDTNNSHNCIFSHHIFSKALSASEVAERSAILRSIFPEIPFTRIGDQIWSVRNFEAAVTPQGNLIPEVQSNTTWATSQTLYNNAFDAASGTVEQKTYAGVKAAAMWCHYGNLPEYGAIYGKLYNWFAVKLLQMDIDYYNANNPTTPWGWRVPTQADFNTLATTLGGAAVAGGKMKTVGTAYWNSPNTGATNESGFSAIGVGFNSPGSGYMGQFGIFYCQDNHYRAILINTLSSIQINNGGDNTQGHSLRLIKA